MDALDMSINLLCLGMSLQTRFQNMERVRELGREILESENRLILIMESLEGGFRHFNLLLLIPTSTIVLGKGDQSLTTVLSVLEALDMGPSNRNIVAIHRGL